MGAIENVLRINPNALDARGNLKSFTEQYGEYALARELDPRSVDRYTPFVLSMDSGVLGVPGLAGRPLLLSNTSLKHIQLKHGARTEVLNGFAREMREHVIAYQDPGEPRNIVFALEAVSERGNRIISIVRARAEQNGVAVSQVRSVHGKRELEKEMMRTLDKGLEIWTNERTGRWLRDPRTLSAEAELSSEASQRLLEIHYTQHPEFEPAGFAWRAVRDLCPADAERFWGHLGNVPVDEDGLLLSRFRDYPEGTDREEVWLDYDERPEGVRWHMFPGDRERSLDALESGCRDGAEDALPGRDRARPDGAR